MTNRGFGPLRPFRLASKTTLSSHPHNNAAIQTRRPPSTTSSASLHPRPADASGACADGKWSQIAASGGWHVDPVVPGEIERIGSVDQRYRHPTCPAREDSSPQRHLRRRTGYARKGL